MLVVGAIRISYIEWRKENEENLTSGSLFHFRAESVFALLESLKGVPFVGIAPWSITM